MSQEKLRTMLELLENRNKERHSEVLDGIKELRNDFKKHIEQDDTKYREIQNQFSNIYKSAAAVSLAAFVWAWNWITR